jgi:Domain of unknown function (DUF4157)
MNQRTQAMRMPAPSPIGRTLLQRQCACGAHTGGGDCDSCDEKKQLMRRSRDQSAVSPQVPSIVHDVLRSPGEALDSAARASLEPRFGHDFSQVRVHADSYAARSADAVNAVAYTVGRDVVFAAGRYEPHSEAGRSLLAHELTHVAQQSGSAYTANSNIEIGSPDSNAEHEADTMARHAGGAVSEEQPVLRRQETTGPAGLTQGTPELAERARKLGIDLPTVSEKSWKEIGDQAANKTGQALTEPEKTNIDIVLKGGNVSAATPLATPQAGKFLLHDTSASVTSTAIADQQAKGRGPLGSGVAAYVPKQGDATITRPNFNEERRPTTTDYEKAVDKFEDPVKDKKLAADQKIKTWKKRRDDLFRQVWNATQPAARDAAFGRAVAGMGLTPDEIKSEKTGNNKKRDDADFNPGIDAVFAAGSTEKVTTSAAWTIEEICKATPLSGVAVSGHERELTDGCAALSGYFAEHASRVSSIVPVEIVQPGVKSAKGNQNTCNPNNPNNVPLDDPPYTADQYNSIALLYLRAARTAGQFPQTTTHFQLDAFVRGHCDPRCFDLGHLYELIAAKIGHSKGSTYGLVPSYGMKWGANNVWWDVKTCHGAHP